jgi:hypothetical protein
MGTLVEMAAASSKYMEEFEENVVRVLKADGDSMIELNQNQLLESSDSKGKALTRVSTGSTKLSRRYAILKGKSTPNLFDTGKFFKSMFFTVPAAKEYFISSTDKPHLNEAYGGTVFGIAPANQPIAKEMNNEAIILDYKKNVFL